MNYKQLLILTLGFSTLVGCGGDSDSKSSNSGQVQNLVDASNNNIDPASNPTAFLTASEEFEFSSNFAMGLDVDINTQERAFFQVCTSFEGDQLGSIEIDYDSCVIRTPLKEGKYQGDIPVTNDKNQLVAEIWFYSETAQPQQYLYEITDRTNASWVIR